MTLVDRSLSNEERRLSSKSYQFRKRHLAIGCLAGLSLYFLPNPHEKSYLPNVKDNLEVPFANFEILYKKEEGVEKGSRFESLLTMTPLKEGNFHIGLWECLDGPDKRVGNPYVIKHRNNSETLSYNIDLSNRVCRVELYYGDGENVDVTSLNLKNTF